jgi:aspartate dehydrogenase
MIMGKMLKIVIVGCGAIGGSLARKIVSDFGGSARLVGIYDIDGNKAISLASALRNKKLAFSSLDKLIKASDLVIEAASAGSSYDIAHKALAAGRDIMIMSVGGIIEGYKKLNLLAKARKRRIYIPSGAICGLDGLKAALCGTIYKVTLTTRKPPLGFKGVAYIEDKKIILDAIKEDKVLFEGSALEAVKYFPQNINVAAVLSIAGLGAKHTSVKIVASPSVSRNTHEVEIQAESGRIMTRTENVIHPDNPKTSYLAVLSAIATLRQILEPLKIGN